MIHRLLCCSDTHGRSPPALPEQGATAWLHGGDVMHGPAAIDAEDQDDPLADPLRAPVAKWFTEQSIPIYVVRGNHDIADDFGAFRNAIDVGGFVRQIAPQLFIAGIGWHGEKYFELPSESDLEPICQSVIHQATRLVGLSDRLVLLTHYPPRFPGMREMERDPRNGGLWYDCVRELVEALQPVAVVQGHVHGWSGTSQGVDVGGRPLVIFHPGRIGGRLLVDLDSGTADVEWPSVT